MKNLFQGRCEIILTTMYSGSIKKATTKQVATWLEISEPSAGQFLANACTLNILKKVGAGYNTAYQLSTDCYNSLQSKLQSNGNVINQAVSSVVNWFLTKASKVQAQSITTESGKKLVKVQSSEELDAVSKQAIDQILTIINQNKELKAEVELLREEIERLKPYEEKYNQIKQLTK